MMVFIINYLKKFVSLWFFYWVLTGCSDSTLHGKSIEETFIDKQVVKLIHVIVDENIIGINNLISKGVDVNTVGLNNATPLAWASEKMKLKSVDALLQAGADPHQKITSEHSIFSLVVGGNEEELLKVFIANSKTLDKLTPKGMSLLQVAVINRRWSYLDLLLDAGADVNNHGIYGGSAVRTAVALNRYDKVMYFLDLGYSYDLLGLARSVQGSVISRGDGCEWKKKVVKRLQLKGIKFPIFISKNKRAFPGPCIDVSDFK